MKKVFASLLAASMAVTLTGFAAESPVDIMGVSIDNGLIAVETVNHGEDTRLTLTVNKTSSEELSAKEKLYAILQEDAEKAETVTWLFLIPDMKEGDIPGTGTYQVAVRNTQNEGDDIEFKYADSTTVNAFITELKKADLSVTDDLVAYEALDDVIQNPLYEGVYFTIGMDYDLFASKSEAVQNDTLNILHNDGIQTLDKESLPKAFLAAFGVAAFNSGDREEGIKILNSDYLDAAIDEKLKNKAIALMDNDYESGADFAEGFNVAYGLTTINTANINNMGEKLSDFNKATDLCEEEIDKILGLGQTNRFDAFEYMLESIDKTPLKSADALESLLDDAYDAVRKNGTGGSSSGGGGGGGGSFSNSTRPAQGNVSSPTGSGGIDDKYQSAQLEGFADLTADHWASESILYLKDMGIVSGTGDGTFEPDRTVTREEFTKMVMLAFGFEASGNVADFADTQAGAWYLPYISAAVENEIINGIGDNLFGIGQNISRQDMAVIIERTVKALEDNLVRINNYSGFADEEKIADYAKDSVKALYEAGIIAGKDGNRFDPLGNATRAEAAKIIYGAIKGGM